MAWRFTGRAKVNASDPSAFGVCDRCGFWYNLNESLAYQFDYRGAQLVNLRLRVCPKCMDKPFIFYKPIIYPPDPVPIIDPRVEQFAAANAGTYPLPPLPWPIVPVGPPLPPAELPPSDPADGPIGGQPPVLYPPDPPPVPFTGGLESEP